MSELNWIPSFTVTTLLEISKLLFRFNITIVIRYKIKDKIESLTKNFSAVKLNSINEEFLKSRNRNIMSKISQSQDVRYENIPNNTSHFCSSINHDENMHKHNPPYFPKGSENKNKEDAKLPLIIKSRVNQLQNFMENEK